MTGGDAPEAGRGPPAPLAADAAVVALLFLAHVCGGTTAYFDGIAGEPRSGWADAWPFLAGPALLAVSIAFARRMWRSRPRRDLALALVTVQALLCAAGLACALG